MSPETPTDSMPQPGTAGAVFCFRVREERLGWNLLQPVPAKTTVDLAALVCGAPEFLGMDGNVAPCQAAVVLSERGDARVVAAIDEAGGVSLVGCPAQLTRGALTTVVQELLVFNGRLWRMPPEEFSSVFEKRLGRSLSDYFSSRAAIGWSENGFRAGLGQSLERGRFPVVLLLAETNQEVAEAIAHLKSHNLEVRPLGVELYESHGVEVIFPRMLTVAEPGPHEEREPAKLAPRPTPPQPRTPPRSQPSTARVATLGVSGSVPQPGPAPARKMPWSSQPSPNAAATEPAPVEQAITVEEPVSAQQYEPAPTKEMPWSDQAAPPVAEIVPPPAEPKPVTAVPPPPKPAPAARPVWDGTMPGVMAGKRPPRKSPQDFDTRKGHEQTTGRH